MSAGRSRILIVDDEPSIRGALGLILGEQGHEVESASNAGEAAPLLKGRPFGLAFVDLRLPDSTGIELLERIKSESPETEVVLMTAHGSLDVTIEAIKRGAFYYLEKPFMPDHVLMLAERALQFEAVKREVRALRSALAPESDDLGLVGNHDGVRQIRRLVRTAAPSDASVLIEGESGTGKELIASAVHRLSGRASGPFIRINCAAIPSELIESELFGYRRGAFTGADRDRRGLIEAAAGGTLLLDEIAEMPVYLQTKLLRVLQERRVRRLGDEQEVGVDFRLISSTNCDTAEMVRAGTLRKDLYFRISTVKIRVPPLRERAEDVALLAETFLRRFAEKYRKDVRGISPATLRLLARYEWPGNVREIESVVEHAVLFASSERLEPEDLPEQVGASESAAYRCHIPPHMTMEEVEREAIIQTLERTGGNVKRAAQILDYHRPTLYRKLKKYGIRGDAAPDDTDDDADDRSADVPHGPAA
ncbi:MAG TPA: sigma-54 dependent transcriptional regulator [Pyrinomonadaceae bacterium]|nr:sigma-54 dependent transcriptional regulator [Pyrinomonadaceae bacterium]